MADLKTPNAFSSPFHIGEQAIQQKVGKRAVMENVGQKYIRPYMPQQHCDFFENLHYVFIGHLDNQLRPWASILFHPKQLIHVVNPVTIQIHYAFSSEVCSHLNQGDELGLLGLDFSNKRRNRISGIIVSNDETLHIITLSVKQSFGNCPKYITTRVIDNWQKDTRPFPTQSRQDIKELNSETRHLISQADSCFVASFYIDPNLDANTLFSNGADVAYRGGAPGFIDIVNDKELIFPDYIGNNFFNTLGNIHQTGKAGLLFINFDTGDVLMLSGKANILWPDELSIHYQKPQCFWKFSLQTGFILKKYLPFHFKKS